MLGNGIRGTAICGPTHEICSEVKIIIIRCLYVFLAGLNAVERAGNIALVGWRTFGMDAELGDALT